MIKSETLQTITILLIVISLFIVALHISKQTEITKNFLKIDNKIADILEDHAKVIRELQEENKQLKKDFKEFKDEVCKKTEVNCPPEIIWIDFKEADITKVRLIHVPSITIFNNTKTSDECYARQFRYYPQFKGICEMKKNGEELNKFTLKEVNATVNTLMSSNQQFCICYENI